jgi:hypothetical protein
MSKVMEKVRNGVDTEQLFGTPPEKLQEVVARAQRRSAVFDMVTNGVPVSVETTTS